MEIVYLDAYWITSYLASYSKVPVHWFIEIWKLASTYLDN